jgi:hypothetical protein
MFEVGKLRDQKAGERVAYEALADRLMAYAERHPEDTPVVEQIAAFLTAAE